jgi:hypothetical protein
MSVIKVQVVRPDLSWPTLIGRLIGNALAIPLGAWAVMLLAAYWHGRYPAVPELSFVDCMALQATISLLGLRNWDSYRWWTADPERAQ